MKKFQVKIAYTDIRIIAIKAKSLEEAQVEYAKGDWDDERSINFYAEEELEPLKEVSEED